MPRLYTRNRFRLATSGLVLVFVLSSFEASAERRAAPVSTEGDRAPATAVDAPGNGSAVARLDGSSDDPTGGIETDVPNRGLVYDGLQRSHKKNGRCGGGYQGRTHGGRKVCSHGPDPAPHGVDVRKRARLRDTQATPTTAATRTPSVPCYGDGSSGPRVQAIYARAADVPDRSSSVVPMIPQWAATVGAALDESAAQTGGRRHVRWVTTPACALDVDTVQLSPAGDDSLTNMIGELQATGYNRTDRKYLVWMDALRYCGIAEVKADDQAGPGNAHNFGPMFGRVDAACWGSSLSVEAHELMHMLGGIQMSAPHSSGGWHCTDESDRMCYIDTEGRPLTYVCSATNEALFDCGHDDYFSTAPAPGSYLATHWNAADNVFLSAAVPDACSTVTATATSATAKRGRRRRGQRTRDGAAGVVSQGPCVPQ